MTSSTRRVVWITGASSGIGRALAFEFARRGDFVILSARRSGLLRSLQRALRQLSEHIQAFPCDVRRERQLQRVAGRILDEHKRVDVLVNNAGVTSFKEFLGTSVQEFDDILQTNLRGAFIATKLVLPSMLRRKGGLILNIVSYAAKTTYTNSSAYSASKAGLEAMMNVLRAEVRSRGIKIMNVYPGAVLTPMWLPKHRRRHAFQMISAEDVARAVCDAIALQPNVMVEELVIRPQIGDLRV